MPITLADAMQNAATDLDYAVIDEYRKSDWFGDAVQYDDAAVPGAGGGTTSYGYTRLVQERSASVRDYNSDNFEGSDGQAKRERFTVDLVPLGATFKLDRALANLGPRTSDEVALQTQQANKAVRAKFNEGLIDGLRQSDGHGFDGLDAALAASSTEVGAGEVTDWSHEAVGADQSAAHGAIDVLDNLLSLLDGEPTALLTNRQGILRLRSLARRAGYYERSRDDFGRQIESYAGIPFVNLGARAGSSEQVLPVEARTIGAAPEAGLTDVYAVRLGMDALHGVSVAGAPLMQAWPPDFTTSGAVKVGEVEMGPVALALKATKAAAVLRNVRL